MRALDVPEGVEVLELGLHPESLGTGRPHRDVRVAAEAALFHVAVVHADGDQDRAEPREELRGIRGGSQVRLGDDLDERHAAAIEVQVGPVGGVGEAFVEGLAGVLFHVDPGDVAPWRGPPRVSNSTLPAVASGRSYWEI